MLSVCSQERLGPRPSDVVGRSIDVVSKGSHVVGKALVCSAKALKWSACGRLCFVVFGQGKGVVGYDVQVLQLEKKKEKNKMGSRQRYN